MSPATRYLVNRLVKLTLNDAANTCIIASHPAISLFITNDMHPTCDSFTQCTVYPKKYAHGFVVLCFVVVRQSFIMNSHEVFIHIHQGCFAGTGAIVRLPQCQWSQPDGYGKLSQCITTTKHSKAKTVCIFLGICCMWPCWTNNLWFHYWYSLLDPLHSQA